MNVWSPRAFVGMLLLLPRAGVAAPAWNAAGAVTGPTYHRGEPGWSYRSDSVHLTASVIRKESRTYLWLVVANTGTTAFDFNPEQCRLVLGDDAEAPGGQVTRVDPDVWTRNKKIWTNLEVALNADAVSFVELNLYEDWAYSRIDSISEQLLRTETLDPGEAISGANLYKVSKDAADKFVMYAKVNGELIRVDLKSTRRY